MKLLLTSAGVKNPSIHNALVDLLGKPIADSTALCIPTAQYGHPNVGPGEGPWRFISGRSELPMTDLGWKSVGVLELTALPSIDEERWVPLVRATDVLLVAGGDALYLCHWMRESGLADLLPSLTETVWVGLSAGSMVMTPRIGEDFVGWKPLSGDDSTLGIVDFSICPHLAPDGCRATRWPRQKSGWPHRRSGVRHRRRDRDPSGRRHGRRRLRGTVETLSRLADKGVVPQCPGTSPHTRVSRCRCVPTDRTGWWRGMAPTRATRQPTSGRGVCRPRGSGRPGRPGRSLVGLPRGPP